MTELLVLWDVDHTLVDPGGLGREAFHTAFRGLFGRTPVEIGPMGGRTDLAIATEVLRDNGIVDVDAHLEAFREAAEVAWEGLAHQLPARGRALPGAADTLAALAGEPVVQSLLTGNVRRLAEGKLRAFALDRYVDFDLGAYGWAHAVRAALVDISRAAAGERHGRSYAGRVTVLVGDTPLDVAAALASGASVVAVASGRHGVPELERAGAHAVLADLTSPAAVLAAIRSVSRG